MTYLEAANKAAPLKQLRQVELTLPISNTLGKKTIQSLPGGEQTFQMINKIEQTLN